MPPKKPAKSTASAGAPRANAPTTVLIMGEPPSQSASSAGTTRAASTHDRTRTKQSVVDYQSPLKKLRIAMRLRRVIDTIDDLHDFNENTDLGSEGGIDSIRIQACLQWRRSRFNNNNRSAKRSKPMIRSKQISS
ncbi:hypothetical protein PF011_g22543 [Phytophthora fragariae]|uniref:Uncharacterized protein n=1 Tax=Phytophthora fragariae TaxID=53985 RepID=A0A6A3II51_9STRA|nr:hypothetical protein PF011_g22543 [Phytophthora fragariae]